MLTISLTRWPVSLADQIQASVDWVAAPPSPVDQKWGLVMAVRSSLPRT